jgi:chemotaxis protein CheZ
VTITPDNLGQHLRDGIKAEISPLIDELRRFTDRRIAELSAEIHATVQLVDFSETNLSSQLSKIQEQIVSLVVAPAAATRNSGLELEAVVQATEAAANQIMEAAEAIGDWLRTGARDADSIAVVAEQLNTIFEACSFQDITGQRVRRAIQHLQKVEVMLTEINPINRERAVTSPSAGVPCPVRDDLDRMLGQDRAEPSGPIAPDLLQDDIDALFGAAGPSPVVPAVRSALEQDDIDRMFG